MKKLALAHFTLFSILACAYLIGGAPARCQESQGSGLHFVKKCSIVPLIGTESQISDAEYGYCAGLVRGVAGTLEIAGTIDLPEHNTNDQILHAVVTYMKQHPTEFSEPVDRIHSSDIAFVLVALKKVYPHTK